MELKLSSRFFSKGVVVLITTLFLALVLYLLVDEVQYTRQIVQVVPWSPEQGSPYVCFAAMKGPTRLEALDCLDTSLTRGVIPSE